MIKRTGTRFTQEDYVYIELDTESKEVGVLYEIPPIDLFTELNKDNGIHNGVTYTFGVENDCHLQGTATPDNSFRNLIASQTAIPAWLEMGAGKTYRFEYTGKDSYLNLLFYDNSRALIDNVLVRGSQNVTIPENTAGIIFRLYILKDTVIDEDVEFHMWCDNLSLTGVLKEEG